MDPTRFLAKTISLLYDLDSFMVLELSAYVNHYVFSLQKVREGFQKIE